MAYAGLGACYEKMGDYKRAEELFREALEINPENDWLTVEAGSFFIGQEEYEKAEGKFRKALETNPRNVQAYVGLGECYKNQGDYDRAEEMFLQAIELAPQNEGVYVKAFNFFKSHRDYNKVKTFLETVDIKVEQSTESVTKYHYNLLYEILHQRDIQLIAMQYPLRKIDRLEEMFDGDEDILFVSNEDNFQEALNIGGYEDYFTDRCYGRFGHTTEKGNRLIAENVAKVILEELKISF